MTGKAGGLDQKQQRGQPVTPVGHSLPGHAQLHGCREVPGKPWLIQCYGFYQMSTVKRERGQNQKERNSRHLIKEGRK